MSNITRFGVSLDETLLGEFDALCEKRGYPNRSEAIRDLIRKSLVEEEWQDKDTEVAATLTLIYDHHRSDLAQRITAVQHEEHHMVITTLHVHLDHHNCLEVIVLKGKVEMIRSFAERLTSTKGVVYGNLSLATMANRLR